MGLSFSIYKPPMVATDFVLTEKWELVFDMIASLAGHPFGAKDGSLVSFEICDNLFYLFGGMIRVEGYDV